MNNRTMSLDVLEQRTSVVERGLEKVMDRIEIQATQFESQMAALSNRNDAQFAALRDTVIQGRVPQWQVIMQFLGLATVLGAALWAAGINPIEKSIDSLSGQVIRNEDAIDSLRLETVPLSTWNEEKALTRQERDAARAANTTRLTELEQRIREADESVVPRGEHQERWRAIDASIERVQIQIDELKDALGGIYGARDVIVDLQRRVDRLDRVETGEQ